MPISKLITQSSEHSRGHLPPFQSSSDLYYQITGDGSTAMSISKSTYPQVLWTDLPTGTPAAKPAYAWAIQRGDIIHIVSSPAVASYTYHEYNMANDTWLVIDELIATPATAPTNTWITLAIRSNGDAVVGYTIGGTDQRCHYNIRSSGTWGTAAIVGNNVTTVDYFNPVCVKSANSDIIHFIIHEDSLGTNPNGSTLVSLLANDTFSADASNTGNSTTYYNGTQNGVAYIDAGEGNEQVAGDFNKIKFIGDGFGVDEVFAWLYEEYVAGAYRLVHANSSQSSVSVGLDVSGECPVVSMARDDSAKTLYAVWSNVGVIYTATSTDGGQNWSTAHWEFDAGTVVSISAAIFDDGVSTYLGYAFGDGSGNTRYAEKFISGNVRTHEIGPIVEMDHTVTNPDADSGTTGWTNELGTLGVRVPSGQAGNWFFWAADANGKAYQDIDLIAEGVLANQIDSGLIQFRLHWQQASHGLLDEGNMTLRFLDGSNAQIGLEREDRLYAAASGSTPDEKDLTADVPPSTRTVRMALRGHRVSGTQLNAYIKNVTAHCRLLTHPESIICQTIVNGDAETGDITGWTVETGELLAATGGGGSGTYAFKGGNASTTIATQVVTLSGIVADEIDNGSYEVGIAWSQNSYSHSDKGGMGYRFLRDDDSLIYELLSEMVSPYPGIQTGGDWVARQFRNIVPAETRKIKIVYKTIRSAGTFSDFWCDDIEMCLYVSDESRSLQGSATASANAGGTYQVSAAISGSATVTAAPDIRTFVRVTRQGINALISADIPQPAARITRQGVNALISSDFAQPAARITRQGVNVLVEFVGSLQISAIVTAAATVTASARVFRYGRRNLIRADHQFELGATPHTPENVTISGTEFGTYLGIAVFSDDLLDNFTDEQIITATNGWSGTAAKTDRASMKRVNDVNSRAYNKPCITNATDLNRNGADLSVVTEIHGALVYDFVTEIAELEPVMISTWVKMATTAADPVLGKWGLLRLSSTDSTKDHNGALSFVRWDDTFIVTPMHSDNSGWRSASSYLDVSQGNDDDWPEIANVGSWSRIDYIVIPSTLKERDGTVQVYRYDNENVDPIEKAVLTINYPTASPWNPDGDIQLLSKSGDKFQYAIFNNLLNDGLTANSLEQNSNDVWLDSIFIQRGSVQRIELCDNSDYLQASHCEIQKVISWTDTEIQIETKQGSFTAGTAYLHVIDETNVSIYNESITLY